MQKFACALTGSVLLLSVVSEKVQAAELALTPKVAGFVDLYWAYSTARPATLERQYATQAVRSNEINVNLAFLEMKVEEERMRGRVALQAGTSVQANYSGEPTVGTVSGPILSRSIQEAVAGYRIAPKTWVDAGIMGSHLGMESFVSRDNFTYTRSLVAELSPYYQTGVRLNHQVGERVNLQAHVLNGWANVSETNSNKAFGTQVSVAVSEAFSVSYNTFVGKEALGLRHFHDLVLKWKPSASWTLAGQFDYGVQKRPVNGTAHWYGSTLISRHTIGEKSAIALRAERFVDRNQIVVTTPGSIPFSVWGGSVGHDRALTSNLVWRVEAKRFWADRGIYLNRTGTQASETLYVSSFGFSF